MFRRTDLPGAVHIWLDGRPIPARPGESAAATLLAADILATRTTPVTGAPRGPFCLMGACFDCLATVDGAGGVQLCLIPVRDGMRIETQAGTRTLPEEE